MTRAAQLYDIPRKRLYELRSDVEHAILEQFGSQFDWGCSNWQWLWCTVHKWRDYGLRQTYGRPAELAVRRSWRRHNG